MWPACAPGAGSQDGTMSFRAALRPDGRRWSIADSRRQYRSLPHGHRDGRRAPADERALDRDGAKLLSPDGGGSSSRATAPGSPSSTSCRPGRRTERISFGQGRYGTPVWSPRGDLIAFTKQSKGRFHIGVMRVGWQRGAAADGLVPRRGADMVAQRARDHVHPRNPGGAGPCEPLLGGHHRPQPSQVPTETGASDPSWSPLLH